MTAVALIILGVIFIPKMITDKFGNDCTPLYFGPISKKFNKKDHKQLNKLKNLCKIAKTKCTRHDDPDSSSISLWTYSSNDKTWFKKGAGYYVSDDFDGPIPYLKRVLYCSKI